MLKKVFFALLLAFALATGIFAGLGQQGNQGITNVPAAGACAIGDPDCPG
jgi:hypothetical protein